MMMKMVSSDLGREFGNCVSHTAWLVEMDRVLVAQRVVQPVGASLIRISLGLVLRRTRFFALPFSKRLLQPRKKPSRLSFGLVSLFKNTIFCSVMNADTYSKWLLMGSTHRRVRSFSNVRRGIVGCHQRSGGRRSSWLSPFHIRGKVTGSFPN